jgi:hypothetical protein
VLRAAFLLLLTVATRSGAQVIETPVPFDSAGRVQTLTPALVARFDLRPPVWPVQGEFVEARLYSLSTGGAVLSVARPNQQVERHTLTDEQLTALRSAFTETVIARADSVSPPRASQAAVAARGAFARNQMILSAIVYGPLVASFADDGETGTALYLLSVGTSFFIVDGLAKNTFVTRTQNDLATDGTLRGFAAASGLLYAFSADDIDRKAYSALGLVGAIGGARLGYEYGTRLTDSEAQAARKFSTLGAATTLGVMGSFGVFENDNASRPAIGAAVAGGLAGYLIGPNYPRRARYTVTAGDVRLLHVGALIGLGAGLIPVAEGVDNAEVAWSTATGGMALGAFIADRTWVRRYDHGYGDATVTWLGTIAGTLMGGAVAILSRPIGGTGVAMLLTGGAFLGALAGQSATGAPKATPRGAFNDTPDLDKRSVSRVTFDASSLAFAAAGVPGRYPIFSLRF